MINRFFKTGILLLFLFATSLVNAQTIEVATYNIRNDNADDVKNGNGWQQRLPYVCNLIKYHGFDIFGTQEGLHHQLQDMKEQLPGFDYTGIGRDDGKEAGEYSAIFYNSHKFDIIQSGDFWLSEDCAKPNMGWDAVCIRICTWGEFKDKATGKVFFFFNLHTDHIGVKARNESAKLVISKIKEIAKDKPVILTGDFNAGQNDQSYAVYVESGLLSDSYDKAPICYDNNGTFNAFDIEQRTDDRIDHIFVTKNIEIHRHGILTDIYWDNENKARVPSDHYPVVVSAELR